MAAQPRSILFYSRLILFASVKLYNLHRLRLDVTVAIFSSSHALFNLHSLNFHLAKKSSGDLTYCTLIQSTTLNIFVAIIIIYSCDTVNVANVAVCYTLQL